MRSMMALFVLLGCLAGCAATDTITTWEPGLGCIRLPTDRVPAIYIQAQDQTGQDPCRMNTLMSAFRGPAAAGRCRLVNKPEDADIAIFAVMSELKDDLVKDISVAAVAVSGGVEKASAPVAASDDRTWVEKFFDGFMEAVGVRVGQRRQWSLTLTVTIRTGASVASGQNGGERVSTLTVSLYDDCNRDEAAGVLVAAAGQTLFSALMPLHA